MPNYQKLKQRLHDSGKTQADLAKHMRLATATVCQKINGVRPMSVQEANSIADFLSIPDTEFASYFFDR